MTGRSSPLTRRQFLGRTAAAALVPAVVPAPVRGQGRLPAPSNRLTLGFIGIGGQGGYHLDVLRQNPEVQVLAVCDVDAAHCRSAAEKVEQAYAADKASGVYKGCAQYGDFRELVARPDIDMVLIATPDHWHAPITVAALAAGKDCYTEKPLSLTVREGRAICTTAKRYGRVLQVGSHERSRANARYACELVRNGRIGKLQTIYVNLPVDSHGPIPPQPVMPVPKDLDWNTWLGPAPWEPYTEKRCHFWFRYILDYSGGEMTDRGAHVLDLAQLGNNSDDTGPVEVSGDGWAPEDGLFNTFMRFRFEMRYASGVRIIGESKPPRGLKFEGTDGWVFVHIHGGNLEASSPALLQEFIRPDETHLGRSPGHHQDFFSAVRTRGVTMAPPEVGHRTATLCHIANIAMALGRPLKWDPVAEQFPGDAAANRMLSRPMREPWHV
jgi:predicted dehydrogenase